MLIKARQEASASPQAGTSQAPSIEMHQDGDTLRCVMSGLWTTRMVGSVDKDMRAAAAQTGYRSLVIDLRPVEKIDTAGAWLVERLLAAARANGAETKIEADNPETSILLDAVGDASKRSGDGASEKRTNAFILLLSAIGERVYETRDDFLAAMSILGATIRGGQMKLGRGHGINFAAIFNQIDRMGVGAIPVVVLMSAIVGAIVAQQGAYQLAYFGADIFVVDLVGILVLRELGVLMTAIMIAGRSGSAITAEIGSMKMREEVDALTVIGLNPVGVLVFPRLVALVVALPCLTILANFAALGGGIAVTWYYSDIPPVQFIDRLRSAIDLSTIFSGLIKAPFMAMIIGIIGAVEGLKVGGSAESLGKHVTASVVKSIFVVIILDGMFAIFYASIDF